MTQYGSANHNSKLVENDIRQIRIMLNAKYTIVQIASIFQVDRTTIQKIKYGKTWTHVK